MTPTAAGAGTAGSGQGTLTLGLITPASTFAAKDARWANESPYMQAVYDTLLRADAAGTVGPDLATEWPWNEDSTVLTLTLRDDVTFSDGSTLTADDAAQSVLAFRDGTSPNASNLADATAVDDATLEITLSQADPALEVYLTQNAGLVERSDALSSPDVDTVPVGSGPYLLNPGDTVVGSSYVLDRNEEYWNPDDQHYDRIVMNVHLDPTSQVNAIKGGQVNVSSLTDNTQSTCRSATPGPTCTTSSPSSAEGVGPAGPTPSVPPRHHSSRSLPVTTSDLATSELTGPLAGFADDRLGAVVDRLAGFLTTDPDLSFQVAAYVGGRRVLDAWGGPHLRRDSLMVPYSASKTTIGVVVGLLVQRGLLDLDERVARYWPEFAQAGKADVTVRQLLSHQAGLPDAQPVLTWDEVLGHDRGADRLAATYPLWRPGSAFGYHGITIGNLADAVVQRVAGVTLHEYYEREVRGPLDLELYLGLPTALDGRHVPILPMVPPLATPPVAPFHPLRDLVFGPRPGPPGHLGEDERSWRFGHPAGSATASARGLAGLLASAVTGIDGAPPLLEAATVAAIGQQQVRGYDEVLGQTDRAHSIVFQKPSAQLAWGGPRSFGHDGAAGAVACVDPDTGVAFGWTVARGPWPGGADPRAIDLARELGRVDW